MALNSEFGWQLDEMFQAILDVHQATRGPAQGREVNRLCLHCAEALENYDIDRLCLP